MIDVEPRFKEPKPERHPRGCTCKPCIGRRNRRSGLAKQRAARKALGIAPNKFGDADEERWSDALFANEVKSGAQCAPARNAWERAEKQIDANRPDHGGSHKPARVVWMPEGWSDGIVSVRLSTWEQIVRPALDAFYGSSVHHD